MNEKEKMKEVKEESSKQATELSEQELRKIDGGGKVEIHQITAGDYD